MHVGESVLKHCYGVMMFNTSTTCINIVVAFKHNYYNCPVDVARMLDAEQAQNFISLQQWEKGTVQCTSPYISFCMIWFMYIGVVYWIVFCYHPCLVSMLFVDLLSLHLVTLLMIFILAFVCVCVANAQECKKYVIQCMGVLILTISGYELLFISLAFMVQNDYGFRGCTMNILAVNT